MNTTAEHRQQQTLEKARKILEDGYNLVTLRECELKVQLASNREMALFFKECDVVEPLNPRDAFFGGRTGPVRLYHKLQLGERLSYCDICRYTASFFLFLFTLIFSLYPFICKYGRFPVGHPTF